MISGSLFNSCKYGVNDDVNENNDDNYMLNNEEKTTTKYSDYKTKIIGSTPVNQFSRFVFD